MANRLVGRESSTRHWLPAGHLLRALSCYYVSAQLLSTCVSESRRFIVSATEATQSMMRLGATREPIFVAEEDGLSLSLVGIGTGRLLAVCCPRSAGGVIWLVALVEIIVVWLGIYDRSFRVLPRKNRNSYECRREERNDPIATWL